MNVIGYSIEQRELHMRRSKIKQYKIIIIINKQKLRECLCIKVGVSDKSEV